MNKITFLKKTLGKNKDPKLGRKIMGISEVYLMIIGVIAFAYLIGGIPNVEASEFFPTGCCIEDDDGGICQSMLIADSGSCSSGLVASDCSNVQECQTGCCYDSSGGACTLNSPKGQCEENGGNWSNEASCNIPECSLGCCIIGEEAAQKTNRECTLLAREYDFEKDFQPLDAAGSCDSYSGLSKEGACVTDLGDGSGEKDCKRTTKKECNSDFYEGYLCTAEDLNTLCFPDTDTTCVEGRDEIYFLDTCDNQANVYDSSKVNDMNYWTTIISPSDSCSGGGADCGNCDYLEGSRCYERESDDPSVTYGDNICRDLSCDNGRQHGESWCIYDYDVSKLGVAPVGSRHFLASCIEGELSIEGCADFNQQICIENSADDFTEAACIMNDWRSCLNANDELDYESVGEECEEYDQCIMVNERIGEENIERSDGIIFTGFNSEVLTEKQGSANSVGEGSNIIIPYCVPKYTPGFQFWSSTTEGESSDYGGSAVESAAICSLGDFTCVSRKTRKCTLLGGCSSWNDNENWECNVNGANAVIIKTTDLPKYIDALTERCTSLGSCGININLEEKAKTENQIKVARTKINKKGDTETLSNSTAYDISENYITNLISKAGVVKSGSLSEVPYGGGNTIDVSSTSGSEIGGQSLADIEKIASQADQGDYGGSLTGQLLTVGLSTYGLAVSFDIVGTGFASTSLGAASIGAAVGYQVGMLIAKGQGWSPGKQKSFVNLMMGTGALLGSIAGLALLEGSVFSALSAGFYSATFGLVGSSAAATQAGFAGIGTAATVGVVLIIAAIAYMIYESFFNKFEEQELYILQYTCGQWEPPSEGDCSLCNDDVRPCSEYRCRSLGSNCEYYTDLGEPGYCADRTGDIWSADIQPWEDALTEGHIYTDQGDRGFSIEQDDDEQLEPWTPISFGVTTDKPATCRLDTLHTDSYDDMGYEMLNEDYDKHSISLSPHVINGSSSTTPGMYEGENRYYIRCKNFAGQINEAEHVVILDLKGGPDLTTPVINGFSIDDNAYFSKGTNSSSIILYVNEPAECKYSADTDLNYDVMGETMSCITDSSLGVYGEWSCTATLEDLQTGENQFFFKCKDQPDLEETDYVKRNVNQKSASLTLNVCSIGVEITSLEPKNLVIGGKSPVETTISAETKGCVDNGVAECFYKFENGNYSQDYVPFYNTDGTSHSQVFSTIIEGNYEVNVKCMDPAGNEANETIQLDITIDNEEPSVVRTYVLNQKLTVVTDEEASCVYNTDTNVKCDYEFEEGAVMNVNSDGTEHTTEWVNKQTYYVKCQDIYENEGGTCDIVVKTY